MKYPLNILLLALLLALLPLSAWAARPEIFIEDQPNVATPENLKDPEPWKEGKSELPPLPKDEDLIEFDVDDPSKPFRYYLDRNSISVGEDEVVRYTLVIVSKRGARNMFYEGMRCNMNEYKTYAFGVKDEFKAPRVTEWHAMRKNHRTPYRYALWKYYFCEPELHHPRSVEAIIKGLTSNQPEEYSTYELR